MKKTNLSEVFFIFKYILIFFLVYIFLFKNRFYCFLLLNFSKQHVESISIARHLVLRNDIFCVELYVISFMYRKTKFT
jgi:hypothetical protein